MKYLAFLPTNLFKMPILKPKSYFYEIMKANMVKNPDRVMILSIFMRYYDFKEHISLKIHACNGHMMTNRNLRPNCASDQKVAESRPPFFPKK